MNHMILHTVCACYCVSRVPYTAIHSAMKSVKHWVFQDWVDLDSDWRVFTRAMVANTKTISHTVSSVEKENKKNKRPRILGKEAAKAPPNSSKLIQSPWVSSHVLSPHNLTPLPPSLCDKWSAHRCNPHWPPLGVPHKKETCEILGNSWEILRKFLGNLGKFLGSSLIWLEFQIGSWETTLLLHYFVSGPKIERSPNGTAVVHKPWKLRPTNQVQIANDIWMSAMRYTIFSYQTKDFPWSHNHDFRKYFLIYTCNISMHMGFVWKAAYGI